MRALDGDGDRTLVAAVAAGDPAAFGSLYDRYADPVFRYCRVRLRDPEAAADAFQEVMLAVWRGAARFGGGSVAAWVFGIAQRRVADAWRRAGRLPDAGWDSEEEEAGAAADAGPLDRIEERVDLAGALARLSPAHQDVLLLAYAFDLSCADIAAAIGVPEGTVKSRLYHARRALAREVGG